MRGENWRTGKADPPSGKMLQSGETTEGNETELCIQLKIPEVTTYLVMYGGVGDTSGYYGWHNCINRPNNIPR